MQIILLFLAAAFTLDVLYRILYTNFNMGSFVICLICLLLWALAFWRKEMAMLFWQNTIGRVFTLLFFCGCVIYAGTMVFLCLAGHHLPPVQNNEAAIVVLGAGIRNNKLATIPRMRLEAAVQCHQSNPDAILVVSGGVGENNTIAEAVVMAEYLKNNGIPETQIFIDDKSTSTEENFVFTQSILQAQGLAPDAPVVYVTNYFHGYRAYRYALRAGLREVRFCPAAVPHRFLFSCYLREALAAWFLWVFRR